MQKIAPGGTFVFVISIIMLIFAVIALFGIPNILLTIAAGGLFVANGTLSIVVIVLEILAGIMGIMFAKKLEKAGLLFTFGIILLAIVAINLVISIVLTSSMGFGGLSAINFISLILPILYLLGAARNKKAA
jgi:hypothetical protein